MNPAPLKFFSGGSLTGLCFKERRWQAQDGEIREVIPHPSSKMFFFSVEVGSLNRWSFLKKERKKEKKEPVSLVPRRPSFYNPPGLLAGLLLRFQGGGAGQECGFTC